MGERWAVSGCQLENAPMSRYNDSLVLKGREVAEEWVPAGKHTTSHYNDWRGGEDRVKVVHLIP